MAPPPAPSSCPSLGVLPGHSTHCHPFSHPQGATAALPNSQDGLGGPRPADHSPGDFYRGVRGGEGGLWLLEGGAGGGASPPPPPFFILWLHLL